MCTFYPISSWNQLSFPERLNFVSSRRNLKKRKREREMRGNSGLKIPSSTKDHQARRVHWKPVVYFILFYFWVKTESPLSITCLRLSVYGWTTPHSISHKPQTINYVMICPNSQLTRVLPPSFTFPYFPFIRLN